MWGFEFRVWGFEFRVWGLGLGVGSFRGGSEVRVQGCRVCRISCGWFRVGFEGLGCCLVKDPL